MSQPPISSPTGLPTSQTIPSMTTAEERNWGMACHLSSLCGFIGVPFGNILGPLVCWLIKKNDSTFVDEQGKESLNFHISLWIYALLCGALWVTVILIPLAILLAGIIWVTGVVCAIVGAVRAANGETYRYPFTLRLIS